VSRQGPVRVSRLIAGDAADLVGWPRLVEEYSTWMGVRGYSPATIRSRRELLALLVEWLDARGISRPVEVSRPVLEAYQRSLFHYRKPTGGPRKRGTCCTTRRRRSSCRRSNTGCRKRP
jgi:integrase/recombinase XerD